MNSIARNSPLSGELHVVEPDAYRRIFERLNENNLSTALRCVSGRLPPWLDRVPEIGEPPARPLGTAAGESVRKHDRVHRTGRSALTFTGQPTRVFCSS